ncbi:MICA2 monooxygenase, partial [Amia calva]|nr:MICA2 monooxygenase [Amia calva]
MTENPRFAKPKDQTPPENPQKRQFQSSASVQCVLERTSEPLHSPEYVRRKPRQADKTHVPPDSSDSSASCRSAVLAVSGMLQRLQRLEETITQKKAQSQSAREFQRKSVKEKAAHLCSLFGYMAFQPQTLDKLQCRNAEPRERVAEGNVCSGNGSSQLIFPKHIFEKPESKQAQTLGSSGQMTVGKVSSVIGAMAEVLVTLYENDHRPKPCCASPKLGSLRKEFPQNLGGSDICHFCKKRVYVMERLSTEGRFFHRECFRCNVCSTTLRLGLYAFDVDEGTFYCKPHFAQRKASNKHRKRRVDLLEECMGSQAPEDSRSPTRESSSTYSAMGSLESQPPGTLTSFFRKSISWPLRVTRDVFDIPRRLSRWMHGTVHATSLHFRDNANDYAYLYELLSLGVPLLCMLQEILGHMYAEAGPLTLENVLEWVEQHLGVKLN